MSKKIIYVGLDISESEFLNKVNSGDLVNFMFIAKWCLPAIALKATVIELYEGNSLSGDLYIIDTDDYPDLPVMFNVDRLPAIVRSENDTVTKFSSKELKKIYGARGMSDIQNFLK